MANPQAFEVTQPNGKKVKLHIRGDESFNWQEDKDGFTVVEDNGRFYYAQLDTQDRLIATPLQVGAADPTAWGLRPRILPLHKSQNGPLPDPMSGPTGDSSASLRERSDSVAGTLKNLVVLCMFSNHVYGVHTRGEADYEVLFNTVGGDPVLAPTGSVKDYFLENSYGALYLESGVVAWVTLPHSESYYANGASGTGITYPRNAQGMVEDALDLIDPLVNLADFDADNDGYVDALTIIHSGYGAEWGGAGYQNRIWSHRWSLWALHSGEWISSQVNGQGEPIKAYHYHTEPALWGTSGNALTHLGVICHETGHFLGLPDLYDTDGTSEGIGSYCLMANSWGFNGTQYYPPHLSAWCKIQLGWAIPTEIVPGTYTATQVESHPAVYQISQGYPLGEYLLVENRQPAGFESDMPQGGLAIWHIDEAQASNNNEGYPGQVGWPLNNRHYRIALLQADGLYEMERKLNRGNAGDVYHASGISTIGPTTSPNTQSYQNGVIATNHITLTDMSDSGSTMTFTYRLAGAIIAPDTTLLEAEAFNPPNGYLEPNETVTVSFGLTNLGMATTNLVVTLLATNGVSAPSGPQDYGALLPNGPAVARSFTFTATGVCGEMITATFALQRKFHYFSGPKS